MLRLYIENKVSSENMKDKTRGGARLNAGRPKVENKAKSHTICLTDADWLKFKELGGTCWLRQELLSRFLK